MTTDYKSTLNLPKTSFPMQANLTQREPLLLKRWMEEDVYHQAQQKRAGQKTFTLHDGPPYANGNIHMGHAINKTLKDFVIKSKWLSGLNAPYVPGWDCHGLPIEINVEKKWGKPGTKLTHQAFRKACRQYAADQVNKQRESFKRLGIFGEWDHPYLTMDFHYEANIIRSLAQVIQAGHLQRGYKPVYWCIDCQSALAEAEVEYINKHSPAIDVRFQVVAPQSLLERCHHAQAEDNGTPITIPIWTTTPWTLPANQAVAVNPQAEYVVVQCQTDHGEERLLIAEALLSEALLRYGFSGNYRIIAYCLGEALEGLLLQHPFEDRQVPVILGDHVTLDTGTGAVHTAPAHGQDDYIVGKKYNLPVHCPVNESGRFIESTPFFAGQTIYEANDKIIELLKLKGALLREMAIEHSYPHCWRHKTPLIFRTTPQWFISMDNSHPHGLAKKDEVRVSNEVDRFLRQSSLREKALTGIKKATWLPAWGEQRITDMVAQRPDWCISRQRTWGVPLALFIHRETGELHPNTPALMETIAKQVEQHSADWWYDVDPASLIGEDDAKHYTKSHDILDVWFESGVSHYCVLNAHYGLTFPADLYLEGNDQYRGWFQSSLMTACAMNREMPFKTVVTHGFIVDAEGAKMSKSLGNVITPEMILKKWGADILKLWIASTDYTKEIILSDEALNRIADVYRRIRNTMRFLLSNLNGFDLTHHAIEPDAMLALDRWAVDRARVVQTEIREAFDHYQFHLVYQKIHHFCSIDMGSFYLDIIKDRQYTMQENSLGRRSCQTAMRHIAEALARWIAPILSFTADEIWQHLPDRSETSVFYTTWYDQLMALPSNASMNAPYWQTLMQVRIAVNNTIEQLRNNKVLGSSLEAEVVLYADGELKNSLTLLQNELRFVLITSTARVDELSKAPADAADFAADMGNLGIYLFKISVTPSSHKKCARCWHRRADIGIHAEHPELCERCVSNLPEAAGEKRQFA